MLNSQILKLILQEHQHHQSIKTGHITQSLQTKNQTFLRNLFNYGGNIRFSPENNRGLNPSLTFIALSRPARFSSLRATHRTKTRVRQLTIEQAKTPIEKKKSKLGFWRKDNTSAEIGHTEVVLVGAHC